MSGSLGGAISSACRDLGVTEQIGGLLENVRCGPTSRDRDGGSGMRRSKARRRGFPRHAAFHERAGICAWRVRIAASDERKIGCTHHRARGLNLHQLATSHGHLQQRHLGVGAQDVVEVRHVGELASIDLERRRVIVS